MRAKTDQPQCVLIGCVTNQQGEAPDAATQEAIAELEQGKGKKYASVEALMADLNEDD